MKEEKLSKVFLVLAEAPMGDAVLGVYSSKKKAEYAVKSKNYEDLCEIRECDLDAALLDYFEEEL
jgi:hypothetical protein